MEVLHVTTTSFSVILWPTQEQAKRLGINFVSIEFFLSDALLSFIFQYILLKISQTMTGNSFHPHTIQECVQAVEIANTSIRVVTQRTIIQCHDL